MMRSLIQSALLFSTIATLAPSIALTFFETPQAQAQSVQLLAKRPQNASNSSSSGGRRGECPVGTKTLKALIPDKDPGQTTQDYPTFWFYVPFGQTSFTPAGTTSKVTVTSAKFMLLDENRKPALKKPIVLPLPAQAGIVHFTLPATEKPLEVGKDYNWFLSIVCDAKQPSANPSIYGWITRTEPTSQLANQLKSQSQTSFLAYKENGFWLEYVSQLANDRAKQQDSWKELLKLFDLQDFSQAPIIELSPAK